MEREQAFLQLGQVDICCVPSQFIALLPISVEQSKVTFGASSLAAVIRKLDDTTSHSSYVTFSISITKKRSRNEYEKVVDESFSVRLNVGTRTTYS